MGSLPPTDEVSQSIRQEIIRFESVHPSIYAIYDLVDTIDDKKLSESLRNLVVLIEDAFVNSQEWTLSHRVPDIKLGLLGSVQSGKSALVHRYLTGTYLHEESPEGGRFKKEVSVENQSHLLLIRDEGGPPDLQFSRWVDGVIFVFSLENYDSYQTVYDYFTRLSSYRNTNNLPILLVGTQVNSTTINSSNSSQEKSYRQVPTSIPSNTNIRRQELLTNPGFEPDLEDYRPTHTLSASSAANLAACVGVRDSERLFQTLNLKSNGNVDKLVSDITVDRAKQFGLPLDSPDDWATHPFLLDGLNKNPNCRLEYVSSEYSESLVPTVTPHTYSEYQVRTPRPSTSTMMDSGLDQLDGYISATGQMAQTSPIAVPKHCVSQSGLMAADSVSSMGISSEVNETRTETNESLTPSSTPTHSRKNRRKSNLFQKKTDDEKDRDRKFNGIGSGRAIPLKQGFLYKRSCKPLSKEWKTKKYVTLTDNARLTYHPSINDYMEDTHGKEIDLSRTTVKIPGIAFRQIGGRITSNGLLRGQLDETNSDKQPTCGKNTGTSDTAPPCSDATTIGAKDSASVKKRHRRIKSNPKNTTVDGYDSEGYEFQLISMDRQWHFEAKRPEDRDEWVLSIEKAILMRLQSNESSKRNRYINNSSTNDNGSLGLVSGGTRNSDTSLLSGRSGLSESNELAVSEQLVQSIRSVAGNKYCADCGAEDPVWASLNLGAMVCIGCSGIHRQLGTHITRIRSLQLDEWSSESVSVMCAIGNTLANSVWEAAVPVNAGNRKKPDSSSFREEKERWIRSKYDHQDFLPPLPYPNAPLQQQLIDAIARQDTRQVILCLALATPETVNAAYSPQDPRAAIHIAATLGNMVYLQLLLWYNGDPTVMDHEGRNAYYYAHCSQKHDCAEFLSRNGCPKQLSPPGQPNGGPMVQMLNRPAAQMALSPVGSQHAPVGIIGCLTNPSYPNPNIMMDPSNPSSFGNHNTAMLPPGISTQPYHFSHLQQQQQQQQQSGGMLPPQAVGGGGGVLSNQQSLMSLPPHSYAYVPQPNITSTSMLQSINSTIGVASTGAPLPPASTGAPVQSSVHSNVSGMVGSNSGGLAAYRSTQPFPPASAANYTCNVNQALGATLPRRRGPPGPLSSAALQPFNQHSTGTSSHAQQPIVSGGTHRPVSRPDRGIVRPPSNNGTSSHPALPPHATSYSRPPAMGNSTVSTSGLPSAALAEHYLIGNQEVGL